MARVPFFNQAVLGLALLGVLSGAPSLRAQSARPGSVDLADLAIVRKVDDHYNHLNSLRAAYSEHYAGMGMDRTETGTLLLKKPGRMRWSYAEPVGKLFILDGKYGWFYTPGDAQAQRIPAKQLDDLRSPLRFLLGHTQLQKELDGLTVAPVGGVFRIAGVPKGMAQRVKLLSLTVTAGGAIERMRLEEVDGAVTEFTFSQMQENVPVRDADFRFTPPDGVSVVEGLPPI
ncbi:MAG TPA: outer membrane lipoprotein carrier protein LolA [Granulicella sp.]|nr:outer membrane lipoprotein carrier protein LolA [Granulicella sp.]